MTKINLLPGEILEKRKSEIRVFQVVGGFLALFIIFGAIFYFLTINIRGEEEELSRIKADNERLNRLISEYKVYEQRKAKLQELEKIATNALAGEVNWHKILNEISMVIPSDVWLEEFTGDATTGIICKGYAVDYDYDTPDLGHKPVAVWIVRMGEIKALTSIWLNYSQKTTFLEKPAVEFELSAQLEGTRPASAPAAPPSN